ncbi:MAG: HupE/UreJ family protein [Calditrichaeota bacterium]|nr:MAG: HupE/UreJ family protein [Calditrichota bacterium]
MRFDWSMRVFTKIWATIIFPLLSLVPQLHAHDLFTSYTSIEIKNSTIFTTVTFDLSDLDKRFLLDNNKDGQIDKNEIQHHIEKIFDYVQNHISIIVAGKPLELQKKNWDASTYNGFPFLNFHFTSKLPVQLWKITLKVNFFDEFGARHKNLVKIIYGSELQEAILTTDYPEETFHFEGRDYPLISQVLQFLHLGVEHIFLGYDHILFLIGLILLGGTFLNLIKIVTAFTVAHSITLILAALQIVLLPGRLVESVIALSIAYIALENLFVKDTRDRWMITFIFGLMHGFGFAGVLNELGLPTRGLVPSLLAFNVGVEIGQLVIVSISFPLILQLSKLKWQKQIVYGLSTIIFIFGFYWFIERAFLIDLPLI